MQIPFLDLKAQMAPIRGEIDAAIADVLDNTALIIAGSLVGSSGTLLTILMGRAMNRSLANVLFGAFGAHTPGAPGAAGDGAGPVLGVPIMGQAVTWNSSATYIGAQSRRRTLNAYNQTPAPWQAERVARLDPLNRGQVDPAALEVLRQTGTRQVVVIDEPRVFAPGEAQATVDRLVASGRFLLVTRDGPLALLELTG